MARSWKPTAPNVTKVVPRSTDVDAAALDCTPEATRLAGDLTDLGVRPGGVLLVHASLSSLGYIPGGAATTIDALQRALGDEGTLLIPALSYATVNADQPVFDLQHTPSCIGAIPEYFRTRADTWRSASPTHSVCGAGPRAAELLADQHLDDTPVGPHSPFRRLRDAGGQLLFLGCGMRPNTSMHGVEEVAEAPYLFKSQSVAYTAHLPDGIHQLGIRRHNFDGWEQRYERVADQLTPEELRIGPVLKATAHLLDVPAMWERALAMLARDPYCFVQRREDANGDGT
ncbi:MAG: AAC(3) family N-acetyltransferase [Gemmatimonadetes bacterium]|nr:AAC(3) family N-acetyltransferase [Gemmatimonadota bacterium]